MKAPPLALPRVFVATMAGVLFVVWLGSAMAQDGHQRWHHYYQHWKQPGTDQSCYSARQYICRHPVTGDCESTQATIRAGRWYAKLPRAYQELGMGDVKGARSRFPTPRSSASAIPPSKRATYVGRRRAVSCALCRRTPAADEIAPLTPASMAAAYRGRYARLGVSSLNSARPAGFGRRVFFVGGSCEQSGKSRRYGRVASATHGRRRGWGRCRVTHQRA